MDNFSDVRAELMYPARLRARREAADIAFLPMGTIEWHGIHGPIGTDGLKTHHICCVAARKLGGGVVFPAMFWSAPRDSFYMDIRPEVLAPTAAAYGIEEKVLRGVTGYGGADMQDQWLVYQRVLRMALEQIAGFGFRSIYLCCGHGPLLHFARPVAVTFSRATWMAGRIVTTDWAAESEPGGFPADHAGKWETSLMMSVAPESVDLNQISRNPNYAGVGAGNDAVESSREQGDRWIEDAASAIANEARWLVDHYPELPIRHEHQR